MQAKHIRPFLKLWHAQINFRFLICDFRFDYFFYGFSDNPTLKNTLTLSILLIQEVSKWIGPKMD